MNTDRLSRRDFLKTMATVDGARLVKRLVEVPIIHSQDSHLDIAYRR